MNDPFDLVCSRVPKLRPQGPDRARGPCQACGSSSGLSVGRGDSGAVLLKCFAGCDLDDVLASLGLEIADLFPPRDSHAGPMRRRRLLSATQALDLLDDEARLIAVCGANIAHGVQLTDDDRARCLTASGRIAYLREEARA